MNSVSKRVALVILLAVLFIPSFAPATVLAETIDPRGANCNEFDPTEPTLFQSRIYVDKTDTSDTGNYAQGKADRTYPIGQGNALGPTTQVLKLTENLKVYAEAKLPDKYKDCGEALKTSFKFEFWTYHITGADKKGVVASYDAATTTFYGSIDYGNWAPIGSTDTTPGTVNGYVYFCKNTGCASSDQNGNDYIEKIPVQAAKTPTTNATAVNPTAPLLGGGVVGSDPNALKSAENVTFKFIKSSTSGLRDKYRVLLTESAPYNVMTFGQNGLGAINLDWGNAESVLTQTNQLKIPSKDVQILSNPFFRYVGMGLNYADAQISDDGCKSGYFTNDCSKVIFLESDGKGKEATNKESLQAQFNPTLNNSAWAKSEFSGKTAEAGKPLGTVKFRAIPLIWASRGALLDATSDWFSYVYGSKSVEFTLEVYKTEADIKAACEADTSVTDKTVCSDPAKMRYEVGQVVEATTGTDQKSGGSAVENLFNFIRKVVAYIVLLLTSIIYYVFSAILVPVIVALIGIHPYQDVFVNFIYPGWLIIRNISNIFFIVALLWVGLRTLLQLEDATKNRSFILQLILAALLVNFSLVIGQSIVAIADTVQSQFLPEGTKVVESLGSKLMVDPIVTFRGGSDSLTDVSGDITTDALASDLPKAIILLVLAVSAFFAFVALIAFMVVRLAALWILYLLSPLAYVGRILPQTAKYADKWWSEFIKYAFAVPIMAFFLNITALLAIQLSSTTGTSVQTGNSGTTIFGGLINTGDAASSFVSFAVTVMSHFVILAFMFMGMKFALSFGGAGAEKIVGAAQTGFKKAFEYPWRGAKGVGRFARDSAAAGALESKYVKDRPKLANTIAAVAQPTATAKALRDKLFTQPKKKQLETIAKHRSGLEDFAENIGANKLLAAKMLGYKLTGNTAAAMRTRQAMFGKILTDDERSDLQNKISDQQDDLRDINAGLIVPDNKFITKKQAELFKNNIDKDLERIDSEEQEAITPLEDQRAKAMAKGQTKKAAGLEKQISDIKAKSESDRADRRLVQEYVEDELAQLPPNAADDAVFSLNSSNTAKGVLTLIAKDVKADINELEGKLKNDDDLRSKNRISKWDDDDREKVETSMTKVISQREWPSDSAESRAARMAKENEEIKKFDGIDDPEAQIAAFKTAISKNNPALASAVAKQMSKSGNFDKLLRAEGYKNNLDDFKKFMAEKFKGSPVVVRNQVASEISSLNLQNGNRAVAHATTVNSEGVVNWNSKEKQETLLAKSASKKKVWEKKSGELFRETSTGQKEFLRGEEEEIHRMAKNPDQLKRVSERMSSKTAADLLDLHEQKMAGKNVMNDPFDIRVVNALKRAAGTI